MSGFGEKKSDEANVNGENNKGFVFINSVEVKPDEKNDKKTDEKDDGQ